ncbi:hypothetical protein GMOD_00005739 [Pyrenophora seminiperda CCB06]|uniref:Uncharacterized protein n=1 Tax=Pyrenophora seminiperda CCB06 TaxID=1302712 RepID=A0A3M7M9N2_9PLEO|nr:hypothetical protein GMOD_00005739 [Pyrenophora seminiperda CCB06]
MGGLIGQVVEQSQFRIFVGPKYYIQYLSLRHSNRYMIPRKFVGKGTACCCNSPKHTCIEKQGLGLALGRQRVSTSCKVSYHRGSCHVQTVGEGSVWSAWVIVLVLRAFGKENGFVGQRCGAASNYETVGGCKGNGTTWCACRRPAADKLSGSDCSSAQVRAGLAEGENTDETQVGKLSHAAVLRSMLSFGGMFGCEFQVFARPWMGAGAAPREG